MSASAIATIRPTPTPSQPQPLETIISTDEDDVVEEDDAKAAAVQAAAATVMSTVAAEAASMTKTTPTYANNTTATTSEDSVATESTPRAATAAVSALAGLFSSSSSATTTTTDTTMTPTSTSRTLDAPKTPSIATDDDEEEEESKDTFIDSSGKVKKKETEEELLQRLLKNHVNIKPKTLSSATESIGHRNIRPHRRVQSNLLFNVLDAPMMKHYHPRTMSLAELPDLTKFYPGSHLVEKFVPDGGLYLSLWLLPPQHLLKQLSQEIAKLSMKYSPQGSSAPFVPHITIIGSIRVETHREMSEIGQKLRKGLKYTGVVPCRFDTVKNNGNDGNNNNTCEAMYNDDNKLVWSQSCIAMMERSPEYMNILAKAREILELPPGEWMFPGPAKEPHYSKFYGKFEIPHAVNTPPNFVSTEAALYLTTPGTLDGVAQWKEIIRIPLQRNIHPNRPFADMHASARALFSDTIDEMTAASL